MDKYYDAASIMACLSVLLDVFNFNEIKGLSILSIVLVFLSVCSLVTGVVKSVKQVRMDRESHKSSEITKGSNSTGLDWEEKSSV